MKDSQPQKKKPRAFLKKKGEKSAPLKLQEPLRDKPKEEIVFQKDAQEEQRVEEVKQDVSPAEAEKSAEPEKTEPKKPVFAGVAAQFVTLKSNVKTFIASKKKSGKHIIKKQKTEPRKTVQASLYKQIETDIQLALIPLILLAVLSILMLLNNHYLEVIAKNDVPHVESIGTIQPFPLTENIIPPDLSAKAAIVLDADSQVILLSKNPDVRFSMASTTKIMTALTALDHFEKDDLLTVKSAGIDGSVIGLQRGEQLTLEDLLYAMMLPSANDAAVAIADNYPEGREAFIEKMNEKALLLHLSNTHFADPTGLNDDENYTTVVDLARLGSYAMKNKDFAEVVGTKHKTIFNSFYSKQYALTNLNQLLGTNGVNGIKTGTTEGAGEVLVTSTVINDHTFIIVVMNSKDRFADTRELIDFIKEKVQYYVPPLPM